MADGELSKLMTSFCGLLCYASVVIMQHSDFVTV